MKNPHINIIYCLFNDFNRKHFQKIDKQISGWVYEDIEVLRDLEILGKICVERYRY